MTNRRIIAVDPGVSGAVVVSDAPGQAQWWKVPGSISQFLPLLRSVRMESCLFVIEAQAGAGSVKANPVKMFRFGTGYGAWLVASQAVGMERHAVLPRRWMDGLNLGTVGSLKKHERAAMTKAEADRINNRRKTAWKSRLVEVAESLYPNVNVTKANADALLIAEYARRFIA